MMNFQWNALRRGDAVDVHDTADHNFALRHAEVVTVATVAGSANDVGVSVEPGAATSRIPLATPPSRAEEGCRHERSAYARTRGVKDRACVDGHGHRFLLQLSRDVFAD